MNYTIKIILLSLYILTTKIINYIKVHYVQFLLLILVGIIVYVIDHISNINAVLIGLPSSIPGMSTQVSPSQNIKQPKMKKMHVISPLLEAHQ